MKTDIPFTLSATTIHFRPALKLIDEAFDSGQSGTYNLYFALNNRAIRFIVTDIARNKILALEDYEVTGVFSALQLTEQLTLLCSQHAFLTQTDWQEIRVAVKNQNFTFIPEALFEENAAADFLKLHAETDEFHDRILTCHHQKIEAVSIFTADKYLLDWFKSTFTDKKVLFLHQTSPLLEGVLNKHDRDMQKKQYLYVEQNTLSILLARDGNLEFCNQFYYATPEDFIYYTLLVMQEQKLNPDQDPITVWGDLTHDSALFTMLRKYIRNVSLGKKPAGISFSYKFEDVFDHRYFDLYNLHFCE